MRVLMALMKHETNTFSPVQTDLARFARGQSEPFMGDTAYRAFKNTGTSLGGFIDVAEEFGAEIVIPIAAGAWPSGPVHDDAYEFICERILEGVETGCDVILLDLHGAMVTQSLEDGEGALLERVRSLAPQTPIAVALDMHTNLYPALVHNADIIAGYQTYPHIDHRETGIRAARGALGMFEGKLMPTMAWGNRPMLPHVMRQSSDDFPNDELQARCIEIEAQGAISTALFTGFPHADIENAGLSCVVVTDADQALAQQLCDDLLDTAWTHREAFVYPIEPLSTSLERAIEYEEGPVLLLDHYDNAASGGTMDCMTVIAGVIEAGLDNVAVFAVYDPGAVVEMMAAGIGADITLELGGKLDMPAIGLEGEPLTLSGRVKLISDGRYKNLGPATPGVLMDMGPTVVLDTGKLEIVVVSRHQEPNDLACLLSLGIDPLSKSYIVLKSRIHYRAGFKPIARGIIECAGTGVCTSDYSTLNFENVRRPIYPLDLINTP
jgi:microcystin degradation protein MlrC